MSPGNGLLVMIPTLTMKTPDVNTLLCVHPVHCMFMHGYTLYSAIVHCSNCMIT